MSSASLRSGFHMFRLLSFLLSSGLLLGPHPVRGADESAATEFTHAIVGLFAPEREAALRAVVAEIPEVQLTSIQFAAAEATFRYAPAKAFPGAKPEQIVERLKNLLRGASKGMFGVKARSSLALEAQERVEIRVQGLDCLGCALAAYEAVVRIEGVERATVNFKEGRVVAWVDPQKTRRATIETALKEKGVALPAEQ